MRSGESLNYDALLVATGGKPRQLDVEGADLKNIFTLRSAVDTENILTMQFDFPLRYVGHAKEWDEIIVDGDLEKREFIVFYVKDNQVLAAASSKRDTETAAITELMRLNKMPHPDTLRQGNFDVARASRLCSHM